jgi:hypothetical protein
VTFKKFAVTPATARCCGFPMRRHYKDVLLREPPVAYRMVGYTCQVCSRLGVTEEDMKQNQHRALRVARMVRPPNDLFRLVKNEQRDNNVRGTEE